MNIRLITLAICLGCIASLLPAQTSFSYFTGFETKADTAGWVMKSKADSVAQWCVGTATQRTGNKSLFVSADTARTAGYIETPTGYYIVAYRKFAVDPGTYDLAFDFKAGGEKNTDDATGKERINDALAVAWVPVEFLNETGPEAGEYGKYPDYVNMYGFVADDNGAEFLQSPWRTVSGQVKAKEPYGEYWLVFVWKVNGGSVYNAPGACIDNVELRTSQKGKCAEMPHSFVETKDNVTSEQTITWKGSADSYQLHYFGRDINGKLQEDTVGLTSASYKFSFASFPEGVYSVKVRSICGSDTSVWNCHSNVLMYNPANYCIDYIGLKKQGVVATSGDFKNPYRDTIVSDKGSLSQFSIHTIHHDPDEYDIRTGLKLKTVPDGAVASVRISNWMESPSASASISYDYKVTDESDVFQIRYAAVLQYEHTHKDEDQTRIIVEIFDARTNMLLSECTRSEFNAKQVNNDATRNWNKYMPPAHLVTHKTCPIMWCNWTPIGIGLKDHVGKNLRIRVTLKACAADVHFAYAYFVMDCSKAEISGVACGEKSEVFRVPKGFKYRWYKTSKPDLICSTADTMAVLPTDTATYSVDLINPDLPDCYFTLKASALPRKPIASMSYGLKSDCSTQRVQFSNTSRVFGFWQGDTIPTADTCTVCEWDFGEYGKSSEFKPLLETVPLEGDTFTVTLRTSIDKNWGCPDEKQFTVEVPRMIPAPLDVKYLICDGASVTHDTCTFDKPGNYPIVYKTANGCDSIVNVTVETLIADTLSAIDTICTGQEYDFYGRKLTVAGHYEDTVRSVAGCDSIIRTLDLTVNASLDITLASNAVACAGDDTCTLAFTHTAGHISHYSIVFDEKAKSAGFADIDAEYPGTPVIPIPLPAGIKPDYYNAGITLFNAECGDSTLPLVIEVRYPKTVIAQRWNDVLALHNSQHNGGYDFVSYQWYKNDTPIEGEIRSILYQQPELDTDAEYSVLVTRLSDGVAIRTCGIQPKLLTDEQQSAISVVFGNGSSIVAQVPQTAQADIYNISGIHIHSQQLVAGNNSLPASLTPGIYLLKISYPDGSVETHKIVAGN